MWGTGDAVPSKKLQLIENKKKSKRPISRRKKKQQLISSLKPLQN